MSRLHHLAGLLARVLACIGLTMLIGFACATLADGILRSLANSPIDAVQDLGPVIVAVCVSACLPLATLEKSNIRIHLLADLAGIRLRGAIEKVVEIVTLVVLLAMTRQMIVYAGHLREGGDATVMLEIPVAPFWYIVALMLGIASLTQTILVLSPIGDGGHGIGGGSTGGHP